MYKWQPLQHASCALSPRFIFPVWKWGTKMPQKTLLYQLTKVLKIYGFINFPFWWYQEMWYEDWIMSLHDKLGQARTCFCWITEKLQIVQLKISFHNDNFRMEFFKTGKFCHNNNNIIKTLFKVASKSIHYNWTS